MCMAGVPAESAVAGVPGMSTRHGNRSWRRRLHRRPQGNNGEHHLQSSLMFYRSDNRTTDQLRPVSITPEFITTAEGSVLIEVGNTRVICTASIEETVPPFMRNAGKGWISSEYAMIPRATLTRTPREVSKGRPSGRTHEIQRLIGRSLRAVTDLARLGERTIWIDCDVI